MSTGRQQPAQACVGDLRRRRAQGALVAHVEGTVADPEQHLGLALVLHQRQVQVGGPVQAATRGEAAGVVGGEADLAVVARLAAALEA